MLSRMLAMLVLVMAPAILHAAPDDAPPRQVPLALEDSCAIAPGTEDRVVKTAAAVSARTDEELAAPVVAHAAEAGDRAPVAAGDRPTLKATRTQAEIRIDGVLDEVDWQRAEVASDFRLIFLREDEAPSEKTEVRFLVDDSHIYVAMRCANENPGPIRSSLTPRDQCLEDDHISVHFDTYLDRRRAYIFGVNAHGVQLDGILEGGNADFSWDAVWRAETHRDATGWTAELAIPLKTLRFPAEGGTWGVWFRRQITKNDEVCSWPVWKQSVQGEIMQQAGDLTGLEGLAGGGGFEMQPYVAAARSEGRGLVRPFVPGSFQPFMGPWRGETDANAGLDLQYGVTSTLTANVTVNPDYSQVEADALQIDVNQRFPLFFEEKRPFFLEGAEIFSGYSDLVYTRRIADPVAGGKIVGKQGNLRLGVIAAWDDGGGSNEGVGAGDLPEESAPGFVGIARGAVDVGEHQRVGVLVTHRTSDERRAVPTDRANTVVAGDVHFRLARSLFVDAKLAASHTRVDSLVQNKPAEGAGTFSDVTYETELRYTDGIREVELEHEYLGPDFRTETGFVERVDVRRTALDLDFTARPENPWLRSWQPIWSSYVIHDDTGGLQEWWTSPMIDWVFQKQWTSHTMYVRSMERWQGRDYDLNTYIFRLGNSYWRPLSVFFRTSFGDGIFYAPTDSASFKGWRESHTIEATARPTPQLTSGLTATRSRFSRAFGGEEVFDVWVLGANTSYQFTRRLYARVYPQFNTGSKHLDADVLLGYVVHPGTVLYLGFNGDLDDTDGRQRLTQRGWFFKASYRLVR